MIGFIGGLGTTELIIILVLFMAIFGLGKLPSVARQLGLGVKNFKDSMDGKLPEDEEPAKLEDQSATTASRDAAISHAQETTTK